MTDAEFEELTSIFHKYARAEGDLGCAYFSNVIDELKEMRAVALAHPPIPALVLPSEKVMTAGELITQLGEFPDYTPVLVEGYEDGLDSIAVIRSASVVRDPEPHDWSGEYRFGKPGKDVALIIGRRGHLRE